MAENLSQDFCQRLAQSASAIIGRNVLVTDNSGIILGSPDAARVGTLHGASLDVIATGRQVYHNAAQADRLSGTKPGTTIPIFFRDQLAGTVGITGAPEEISRYAMLIQQMAQIFLEFQERQRSTQRSDYAKLALLQELAAGVPLEEEPQFYQRAEQLGCDLRLPHVILRVRMEEKGEKRETAAVHRVQEEVTALFSHPQDLICVQSDADIVVAALLTETGGGANALGEKIRQLLERCGDKAGRLHVGIGGAGCDAAALHESYQDATLALRVLHLRGVAVGCLAADDIRLEKLALGLDESACRRTLTALLPAASGDIMEEPLLRLIYHWCRTRFRFAETAEALHIHKSTLTYRFRRAEELHGLNLYDTDRVLAIHMAHLHLLLKANEPLTAETSVF